MTESDDPITLAIIGAGAGAITAKQKGRDVGKGAFLGGLLGAYSLPLSLGVSLNRGRKEDGKDKDSRGKGATFANEEEFQADRIKKEKDRKRRRREAGALTNGFAPNPLLIN